MFSFGWECRDGHSDPLRETCFRVIGSTKSKHDRQIEGTVNMKAIRMQVFGAVLFADIS